MPPEATSSQTVRYDERELVALQAVPADIAVNSSHVFVAMVSVGARPGDATSVVLAIPIAGTGPAVEVPGTRIAGVIGGLASSGAVLYLSATSEGPLGTSSVFKVENGGLVPVAGGSNSASRVGNGDGGPAVDATIQTPQGLAISTAGDLFVAESGNSRVRLVRNGTISTYAGTGECFGAGAPPNGKALTTPLCNPGHIAVTATGLIYTAQRNSARWIARIDASGGVTTVSSTFPIAGLASEGAGVLAADALVGRVVRFDTRGGQTQESDVATGLGLLRGGLGVGADGSIYLASSRAQGGRPAEWRLLRLQPAP